MLQQQWRNYIGGIKQRIDNCVCLITTIKIIITITTTITFFFNYNFQNKTQLLSAKCGIFCVFFTIQSKKVLRPVALKKKK